MLGSDFIYTQQQLAFCSHSPISSFRLNPAKLLESLERYKIPPAGRAVHVWEGGAEAAEAATPVSAPGLSAQVLYY